MDSNSLGLAALVAIAGLVVMAPLEGCSDSGANTSSGPGGTGGGGGAACGNGTVDGDEVCDDGNMVSGDGCETDCSFSCDNANPDTGDKKCDDGNPCNGVETCKDTHACAPGTNADDGSVCDGTKICVAGACVEDTCGDGFTSKSEECDDANTANGDGCDACKFSCVSSDAARDCSGLDPCVGNICDDATHTCGNAIGAGDVCALDSVCLNNVCTAIACGDGVMQAGEDCDDGNTASGDGCESDCTLPVSASCGNGVRDTGEQCDDSNKLNLDGCDSACRFEQVQRATWLKMQFGTEEPFCPANKLGSAISAAAQGQIQSSLDDGVLKGTINVMYKVLGLSDLSGTSDPGVEIGIFQGAPIIPAGAMYNGTSDLDWWYKVDLNSLDANRDPLDRLKGFISAKTLNAGPGKLSIAINFAGTPAVLKMNSARLTASVGDVSTPLASTANPPGHLAAEHLDPALQSYASQGQPTDMDAGRLCGNVSAVSLDQVPVPAVLTAGMLKCDQGYTTANSLLDVLVGGCTVFGFVNVIVASQPDQADPTAPAAGAGAPYMLTANGTTKAVNACRDKNNQTVDFNTCLTAASYSGFFKFATGRVIGK